MNTLSIDVNAAGAAAVAALHRGDAQTARRHFQQVVNSGAATPPAYVGLALACQALGDDGGLQAALDKALELDPYDLRVLLMKADSLIAKGDRRGAIAFYGMVKKLSPDGAGLPAEAAKEVRRAHEAHASLSEDLFGHMQRQLAVAGYDEATASRRFNQSLSLLSGRTRRYEQEPRSYFMPELPTIGFYPREAFPWMDAIEDATDDIRAELKALLDDPKAFAPFIEQERDRPSGAWHALLNNTEWTACYLWKNGECAPGIAERCPRTMEALEQTPLERMEGRSPFSIFSRMAPGAWIRPHTGFLNTRLVCHLPLIVPEDCWLRVGNEVRGWEEGKCFAFNDTLEHEARNGSARERIVLIFNVWRPEVTEEERRLVTALMESINSI
jgi:aspartate beta-hydroxylase